jgi:RNA polymerase sigma factor (sigma-70 family)
VTEWPWITEELLRNLRSAALRVVAGSPNALEDAEDLVQEGLLRLIGAETSMVKELRFFAGKVVRNLAIDRHRDAGRRPRCESCVDPDTIECRVSTRALSTQDVRALLATLAGPDVRLLEARFDRGLTIPEIARELGVSPASAKRRFRTLFASLRAQLERVRSPHIPYP